MLEIPVKLRVGILDSKEKRNEWPASMTRKEQDTDLHNSEGENARFDNGDVRVETHVLKMPARRWLLQALVDSVSVRSITAHV